MATGTITLEYEYGLSNGQTFLFDMGAYSIPSGGTYSRHKITCDKTSSADWPVSWGNEYNFNQYYWGNWYSDESKLHHGSYPGHAVIWVKNQSGGWNNIKVTLTIEYTYTDSYAITVNYGTGGTASANMNSASPGTTVTVTSSPSTGYTANTPTATGISFTSLGGNKWSFTMPSSAVTVNCTFNHTVYSISTGVSPAGSGTLSANMATAYYGDNPTLTRTASTGWQFSSWTTTPSNLSINSSLQFTMPAQNVSITANFSKIAYAVSRTDGTGGTSTLSKTSANYGDTITVTCSPSTGYSANTPTASGITFTSAGTNKWTFTMPASAVAISCTYSKISYTVSKSEGTGGTGTLSKTSANYQDTITVTASPSTGYTANTPTATGITFTSAGTNKWTFTMPASNVTVSFTFSKINYTVSRTDGTGGSSSLSKTTANYGDTITVTCTPNTGYSANTPTASGITFTSAGTNKWTFTMPANNVAVSCTYSKVAYTVTVASSPAGGGTVTRDKATAYYGDTVTLTRTATAGWQFSTWSTSPTVTINNSLQFTMPASNVTVTANWTKISYNVTVGVSPSGSGTLTRDKTTAQVGDTVTLTRTASTGWQFSSWTTSPSNLSINSSLKFTMPASAVSVTANFSKIAYAVTKTDGTGGSSTLSKTSANMGDTITVTCTPSTGYSANTPTATNITFTSAGTNKWTFTMPAAAVAVSCTFSKVTYTVSKAANPSGGGTVTTSVNSAQYGDTVTISQTPATGYYFNGWTTSPSVTITNGAFSMPAGNITVTANYLKRSTATLSVSSMTDGNTVTLTIVPDKTTYSHKYKLSFGTNMETSLTNVAAGTTSVQIAIPSGANNSWARQIPNATQKTGGTLTVETYNGSTKIGTYTISSLTYTVPSTAVPTIGTITNSIVRTVGGTTYANVGNVYVQGKCAVRTQVSGSGALGSSVSSMSLTMSGYTANAYKTTVNSGSIDFTSGLLTVSGSCTITIGVTDSRGRTASKTATITVSAYNSPSGTLTVQRVNNGGSVDPLGTYATYSLTKSYTQVGSNSLSWSLTSQGSTASSPAASGNILPNSRQSFSQTQEYTIRLTLTDAFETVHIDKILPTAQFMIYVNSTGDRIAFMKATNDSLDKNGKNGTIEFSSNHQMYYGNLTFEKYIAREAIASEPTTQINSGVNFNDLLTVGVYRVSDNTVASACTNIPENNSGKLFVTNLLKDARTCAGAWQYFMQIYLSIGNHIYTRMVTTNGSGTLSYTSWNTVG